MGALRRFFERSFTERNPLVIGGIGVVVILVAVFLAIVLNKNDLTSGLAVTARFSNAAGLRGGDQVLMAGVPVGTVTGLTQKGDFVYVRLRLSGSTQVPVDSQATVEVETLLGQLAVKLEPGREWSHLIRSGATITATQVPVEFQQLQNATGPLLAQSNAPALNQLLADLAQVTQDKRTQISQIIQGLDKLTSTIDTRHDQVSELIDASAEVAGALQSRDQQLASVVDHLCQVMSGLAARRAELSALIVNTEAVANQTAGLVGSNRARLDSVLADLNTSLQVIDRHQVDLAQALSYLASAVQGFSSIGYSGPNNTPNKWANIYTNLVGGGNAVYGPCGYLDMALDAALGPDPRACAQRVGPQGTTP